MNVKIAVIFLPQYIPFSIDKNPFINYSALIFCTTLIQGRCKVVSITEQIITSAKRACVKKSKINKINTKPIYKLNKTTVSTEIATKTPIKKIAHHHANRFLNFSAILDRTPIQ